MDLPVSFEYEGVQFDGYLSKVAGAGSSGLYHLMINGGYWGQLFKSGDVWRFGSNSGMFEEEYMVNYFASVVTASTKL